MKDYRYNGKFHSSLNAYSGHKETHMASVSGSNGAEPAILVKGSAAMTSTQHVGRRHVLGELVQTRYRLWGTSHRLTLTCERNRPVSLAAPMKPANLLGTASYGIGPICPNANMILCSRGIRGPPPRPIQMKARR